MGKFIDLTGSRFGRLVVIRRGEDYVSPKGYVAVNWVCQCDCGNQTVVRGCNLKSGASTSCGCERVDHPNRRTHGQKNTRLYQTWKGMKDRCYRENNASWPEYGGRGITVCDEWRDSFEAFYDWSMKNGYNDSLTIDRVDNDAGYGPDNCRWVDTVSQQNNKRNNHIIEFNGERHTMAEWSRISGVEYHKLKDRINKCGWDVERALTTP